MSTTEHDQTADRFFERTDGRGVIDRVHPHHSATAELYASDVERYREVRVTPATDYEHRHACHDGNRDPDCQECQAPAAEDGSSTREDYTVALIAEGPTQSLTWPTAAGARAWLDSAQRGADGPKFPHAVVLHRVTTLREVTS